MRVLLIEDDSATAQSIELMLKSESFNVYTTDLGEEGVDLGKLYDYDIILLDLNLPDMSGYEVLRTLRLSKVKTPILILSGMAGIEDKVRGLGFGADDYMTKPFSLEELVARLRGLLRRSAYLTPSDDETLRVGDLFLDATSREVKRGDETVALTSTEFELLRYLMRNQGKAVTRQEILRRVWEYEFGGKSSIVDLYVSYLRKKVDAGREPLLHTVRGVGYMLRSPR